MLIETWIKWEPVSSLIGQYYIDSIIDGREDFKIMIADIENKNKKIVITFENSVEAYRITNKNYNKKNLHALSDVAQGFFKVTNSMYTHWLEEQSHGIYTSSNFIHFLLITTDMIIDVAASYEPIVEVIESF